MCLMMVSITSDSGADFCASPKGGTICINGCEYPCSLCFDSDGVLTGVGVSTVFESGDNVIVTYPVSGGWIDWSGTIKDGTKICIKGVEPNLPINPAA